jgi:hypothetical protein
MALDKFGIMTLPTSLHGGEWLPGIQDILTIFVEQGKGRVEGRSLLCGRRFRLGENGAYPDKSRHGEEKSDQDEEVALGHFYFSLPPHSTGSPG